MYTYIVTFTNDNQEECKGVSKKSVRQELERLFLLGCCPQIKSLRKKY